MNLSNYREISLKEMQELELKVLVDVDKICRKNNIQYFLMFGTLLGAIRHQGFIPWDYDIDVCLLRKEFDKLLDILKNDKEFQEKYYVVDSKTDKNFYFPMAKIVIKDSVFLFSYNFRPKYTNGVHIDIFPFEVQKLNQETMEKRYKKKMKILKLAVLRFGNIRKGSFTRKVVKHLIRVALLPISPKYILKKFETLCVNDEAPLEECVLGDYNDGLKYMRAEWLKESIDVSFEGHIFPVPKDYDKILKFVYNDYMQLPPESQRVTGARGFVKKGK